MNSKKSEQEQHQLSRAMESNLLTIWRGHVKERSSSALRKAGLNSLKPNPSGYQKLHSDGGRMNYVTYHRSSIFTESSGSDGGRLQFIDQPQNPGVYNACIQPSMNTSYLSCNKVSSRYEPSIGGKDLTASGTKSFDSDLTFGHCYEKGKM